jgi:hypothetical protein
LPHDYEVMGSVLEIVSYRNAGKDCIHMIHPYPC